jgi:hypothetical protein
LHEKKTLLRDDKRVKLQQTNDCVESSSVCGSKQEKRSINRTSETKKNAESRNVQSSRRRRRVIVGARA